MLLAGCHPSSEPPIHREPSEPQRVIETDPGIGQPNPHSTHPPIRGMTISCQTWGQEWASPQFERELDTLLKLGINWISIHPYAAIGNHGQVQPWGLGVQAPDWLRFPIETAHQKGIKIMIKPHLAYWGSRFSWRGEIDFMPDSTELRTFFESYTQWIETLARFTHDADAFVIGTELDKLLPYHQSWSEIITKVRRQTQASLTYAANWPDVARVPFWSELDAIGVQAYFPLAQTLAPSNAAIQHAWQKHIDLLQTLHRTHQKPVWFTELGYDAHPRAAQKPWTSHKEFRADPTAVQNVDLQTRLYQIAFQQLSAHQPWLAGGFIWKWFVGPAPKEDFKVGSKVQTLLKKHWRIRASNNTPLLKIAPSAQSPTK